jgi:purine-cytosine permease-like protein
MFALGARQMSTLFIIVFIGFTKLMTALFPDLFPENEWLVYQVWTVAIWLFVMFLPRNVGSAFK